jgi:hypothetical protein
MQDYLAIMMQHMILKVAVAQMTWGTFSQAWD